MKKFSCIITVLVLALGLPLRAEDSLRFSTVPGPDATRDQAVQLIDRIYHTLGYAIVVENMPGTSGLIRANAGIFDGELYRIAGLSSQFADLIQVPTPLFSTRFHVFAKDPRYLFRTWEDLLAAPDVMVGHGKGIRYIEDHLQQHGRVTPVATIQQAFLMLSQNRVDVVITTAETGDECIRELKLQGISRSGQALGQVLLHHYLHKKHASLVPKVDALIQAMQASGELPDILP